MPATVMEKLKYGLKSTDKEESKKEESSEPAINELVERVFTTRNLVHFAHWNTDSYAAHMALGDLYEDIVDEVDTLVETYQGEFGLLKNLETECAKLTGDIIPIILEDANWVKTNRNRIANGSTTIENLVDGVMGAYNKTLYKLKNLK
jgi:hypothetical protein